MAAGLSLQGALHRDHAPSTIASNTNATVVQINYRLSDLNHFPTAIHDVLFGYDWVVKHMMTSRATPYPGRATSQPTRVGVLGDSIGGGLATMLALTECHADGPRISAAAVNDPIVDWAFDDTTVAGTQDTVDATGSDQLLRARRKSFSKMEHCFDPFASPILFFRSAGLDIPDDRQDAQLDEFSELSRLDRDEDFHREQLRLSNISTSSIQEGASLSDAMTESKKQPRRTSKRYPRAGSGLLLPQFRITTSEQSPLRDQARELAKHMRRCVARELATVADTRAEDAAIKRKAEEQVQLHIKGLKGDSRQAEGDHVLEACQWLLAKL